MSWGQKFTPEGFISLAPYCANLGTLILGKGTTDKVLEAFVSNCQYLQYLFLFECPEITNEGLKSLIPICANLQTIDLDKCDEITAEGIDAILPYCTNLKMLTVCTNFSLAEMTSLRKKYPQIQIAYLA